MGTFVFKLYMMLIIDYPIIHIANVATRHPTCNTHEIPSNIHAWASNADTAE